MSNKVKLVVPEAPVPATAAAKAQRKFAQGGLRLGILDNSKGNADHAPDNMLDQLAKEADFVVSAMGD